MVTVCMCELSVCVVYMAGRPLRLWVIIAPSVNS